MFILRGTGQTGPKVLTQNGKGEDGDWFTDELPVKYPNVFPIIP